MIYVRNKEYTSLELEAISQVIIMGLSQLPCKSIDCHAGYSDCNNCEYFKVCRDLVKLSQECSQLARDKDNTKLVIVATTDFNEESPVELDLKNLIKINIENKD